MTGYETDPDVRLMLAVKAGDRSAFGEIVARHGPFLVNFIFKFVGSLATAEDLSQEVLFKVYRAAPNYEPTAKFRTWLLTIASNLCLNRKRWEKRNRYRSLDAPLDADGKRALSEELAADGDAPTAGVDRDEVRRIVRDAILSLPESQRMAVILARYHELSYVEIGEALGLSIMAVKSLLNRAKENLRDRLLRDSRLSLELQTEPSF